MTHITTSKMTGFSIFWSAASMVEVRFIVDISNEWVKVGQPMSLYTQPPISTSSCHHATSIFTTEQSLLSRPQQVTWTWTDDQFSLGVDSVEFSQTSTSSFIMILNWAEFLDNHLLSTLFHQSVHLHLTALICFFTRNVLVLQRGCVCAAGAQAWGWASFILDPPLLHGHPSLSLLAATSLPGPDRHQSGGLHGTSPHTHTWTHIHYMQT